MQHFSPYPYYALQVCFNWLYKHHFSHFMCTCTTYIKYFQYFQTHENYSPKLTRLVCYISLDVLDVFLLFSIVFTNIRRKSLSNDLKTRSASDNWMSHIMPFNSTQFERLRPQCKPLMGRLQTWHIASWGGFKLETVQQACQHQVCLYPWHRFANTIPNPDPKWKEVLRIWRNKFAILVEKPLRPELVGCIPKIWVVVKGPKVGKDGGVLGYVVS